MRVVRFKPEHLQELRLQPAQAAMTARMAEQGYGAALSLAGPAFTVLDGDRPVACIGAQEYHPQRAEGWALLGADAGRVMRPMTRALLGWLAQTPYRRMECTVATGFAAGHRWARLLGFNAEGPPREAFEPDGGSAVTYVRIRGE